MSARAGVSLDDMQIADCDTHLSVADILLRFGAGVDRCDRSLLASVFTDDAEVDFRPCGAKLGLDFPVLGGGETIAAFLAGGAHAQVTSHVVTNTRVQATGASASACSLVDATHLVRADTSRRLRMMNWYETEAVRLEAHWRVRRLVIDNVWFDGDPQALLVR